MVGHLGHKCTLIENSFQFQLEVPALYFGWILELEMRSAWYGPAINRNGIRFPSFPSQILIFIRSSTAFFVATETSCAENALPSNVMISGGDGLRVNINGSDSQNTATRVSLIGLFRSRLGFRLKDRAA